MTAELHLAENALALHLLLESLERLIDVVVANDNLHELMTSRDGAVFVRYSGMACCLYGGTQTTRGAEAPPNLDPLIAESLAFVEGELSIARQKLCEMSHFPARPYLRFPVMMQRQPRLGRPLTPAFDLVADQILHHRIAVARWRGERPAGNRPYMLLELRDGAGIDGPMAGIMHPGGDFIDQQPVAGLVSDEEHLG